MKNIRVVRHAGISSIFVALALQINVVQAEIKTLVDDLILQHGEMLGAIADGSAIAERPVKVGDGAVAEGNMALMHAEEVANIITDGGEGTRLMRECCWRPQPAVYSNFVVGTTQDIVSATSAMPPEEMYNSEDAPDNAFATGDLGRPTISIPQQYGQHMASVLDQIVKVREGYPTPLPETADIMDQLAFDWMSALTAGITDTDFDYANGKLPPDSLASRLIWNWSYQIQKYRYYRERVGDYTDVGDANAYLDTFRDFYNWSCIVCLGAGFYDTLGMYDLVEVGAGETEYRANDYYTAIVALLSDEQQAWLLEQFAEDFKASDGSSAAAPLQVSLGLTMQSQANDHPDDTAYPDVTATYGTHCHSASEVYIPIDPMSLDKKLNNGSALILEGEEGSFYDTSSYMAGLPNTTGANPEFGPFPTMQSQVENDLTGTFSALNHGDIVFWDKLVNHSMFTGRRFQFSAWARIDRPWEGTFFPHDIDAEDADNTIDGESELSYATTCTDASPG